MTDQYVRLKYADNGQPFTIDKDLLVVGDNIIAIRCDDEEPTDAGASVTYADFIIEAE